MAEKTVNDETIRLWGQHCNLIFLGQAAEEAEALPVEQEPETAAADKLVAESYMDQFIYQQAVWDEVGKLRVNQPQNLAGPVLTLPLDLDSEIKRGKSISVKA